MKSNIFRPIRLGKEVFHPQSFDENSFVMRYTLDTGGGVPAHFHTYMDEHFIVEKGEMTCSYSFMPENLGKSLPGIIPGKHDICNWDLTEMGIFRFGNKNFSAVSSGSRYRIN